MKKLILCVICALTTTICLAQTPSQLDNLSPVQLEKLRRMYGESDGSGYANSRAVAKSPTSNQRDRQYNTPERSSNKTTPTKNNATPFDVNQQTIGQIVEDSVMVSATQYKKIRAAADLKNQVYGREIFTSENLTFAPSMSIATPANYVLSAGDQLIIQLWGAAEAAYEPKISPEGNISIPNVGLINVAGLSISQAESRIKQKLTTTVAGLSDGNVHLKITLGDIRSIKVNIVGEAQVPGTYTLPSLATLFNALYAAGGVSDIGSLRNVKLYRDGKELATLDVYDYLLKGRNDVDMRLEDNDMIVVAPYENIVTINGKTKRPRRYETKRGETVQTIIDYSGGFTGDAYRQNVALSRRAAGRQYTMHTVESPMFTDFELMDGDSIEVGEVVQTYANRVSVEGAVWRTGNFELTDSISTVGALVRAAEGLSPDAFGGRAQIMRTREDGTLQLIPVNVARILAGTNPDVSLRRDDRLIVTSMNDLREGQNVTIKGEVNDPKMLVYAEGMTLQDILLLGRGLKSSASLSRIEVARRVSNPNAKSVDARRAELFTFAISPDLSLSDSAAAFVLQPFDEVFVRRSPGYVEQQNIFINGEVAFPGEYTMATSSDRLTDLVAASGGFTPEAYVRGASLQRQINEYDLQRMYSLNKLMESARREKTDTTNFAEQYKIGDYYPVGINLDQAMSDPESASNFTLRTGDILIVPTFSNTVKISGAVYYPTTTTYDPQVSLKQYIKRAGGYNDRALRKPFVIMMNGNVIDAVGCRKKIEPGCEIVVPYRRYVEPINAMGWISLSTSIVSMAAMIASLFR